VSTCTGESNKDVGASDRKLSSVNSGVFCAVELMPLGNISGVFGAHRRSVEGEDPVDDGLGEVVVVLEARIRTRQRALALPVVAGAVRRLDLDPGQPASLSCHGTTWPSRGGVLNPFPESRSVAPS
jgi:hypothetical protein